MILYYSLYNLIITIFKYYIIMGNNYIDDFIFNIGCLKFKQG